MRAASDVSAVAYNLGVYDSVGGTLPDGRSWGGWTVLAGTSLSAPFIAGVYGLAGGVKASDYAASYPYTRGTLFDITTGSDGSCGPIVCSAWTGWDGPTGLGTPNGVSAFSSLAVTPPAGVTALVGQSVNVTPTASGGMAPYTWTDTGLPPGLSFSAATGTISGTLTTAGTYTVTLKATDNVGVPITATFVINAQTPVITPNVLGKTISQATTALENAGFSAPTVVFEIDCGDPSGHVIDQNPEADAKELPGSAVSIGVAKAPAGRGACP
jgi:hypothetical protein